MATRTTLYSSAGKKLYAVRNADGTFKDIQTYQRAHRADMAHTSAAEAAFAAKKGTVKKTAAKKSPAKSPAKKAAARKSPAAATKKAVKKASPRKTAK